MTKPKPKPLTDEQGKLLRERAGIIGFTEQTIAQLNALEVRRTYIEGYLEGAGIPLDTELLPLPETDEIANPNLTRAQRRAQETEQRKRDAKARRDAAAAERVAAAAKKAPAKKKAAKKKAAKKAPAKKAPAKKAVGAKKAAAKLAAAPVESGDGAT